MSGSGDSGAWKRTHNCGELRPEHSGQTVTLNGWIASRRNLGGIYFIDVRDRYGVTQIVMPEDMDASAKLAREDCITVTGQVAEREAPNEKMPTGLIEIRVASIEKLSSSKTPPFEIEENLDTSVELRLKYRYLDLRRPDMQRALMHRSRFIGAMRAAFLARDFAEVETPILTKATPEGARDYLVPSRVHPGEFYALPQSPQLFKQILMVAGMDRYFQVARCFRDEDLRADRQPEFTQLDMEMSFVEEEDVFAAWEGVLVDTFKNCMGVDLPVPFPRLTWRDAMERYGSDKPDTRFGMELVDVADWVSVSGFGVFEKTLSGGGRVMALRVEGGGASVSRGNMKKLEGVAKTYGAKGLAWWKPGVEGGAGGSIVKFCQGESGARLCEITGAVEGDLVLLVGDSASITWRSLGALRLHLGKELGLVPETDGADDGSTGPWNFLWVTRFPMFERDESPNDGGPPRWVSLHHPFTAPTDWAMDGDPGEMESRAYDLVLNGWELGSGSIRIHRQDTQERVFDLLGLDAEQQKTKFGFFVDALSYGPPPHGGFAVGLDRIVAMTLGMESIRDVIAFPKTASAADLMCDAPSSVELHQMDELHIRHEGLEPDSSDTDATP